MRIRCVQRHALSDDNGGVLEQASRTCDHVATPGPLIKFSWLNTHGITLE
jgi:hypothetical protein